MVINVLFLACVLARGGEREGASQWWNVQGPHSPSRTLSISKLRIYNCPVQQHCMQMISQYVNTSCMPKGMTKRYRSRVDGFQSIACPMYRQKVNRMHVAYSPGGGGGWRQSGLIRLSACLPRLEPAPRIATLFSCFYFYCHIYYNFLVSQLTASKS